MSRAPSTFRLPGTFRLKTCAALLTLGLVTACVGTPPPAEPPVTPGQAETAAELGVVRGPSVDSIQFQSEDAAAALDSFQESCRVVTTRQDASGLTRPSDWLPACRSAPAWPRSEAARFFQTYFETAQVGEGTAFATGYFEPEIVGSRTRRPGIETPVYGLPDDLVRANPEDLPESERGGRPPLGRYDEDGNFVRYWDRAAIEDGALEGRGLEIAWAEDPVELFFLEIQGSGRIRTPEGEIIRLGYAGQSGRAYTGIGQVMRERGLIGEGTGYATSMQGIMQYLRDHPEEGREIMRLNQSWVFFRELEGDGPLGSIGVPVRAESSVAVDPRFVPYGAPVFLWTDRPETWGLWIAQDTGGAIRGANRFDTFWGAGERARDIAGGMSARGQALIFLPRGVLDRLSAR